MTVMTSTWRRHLSGSRKLKQRCKMRHCSESKLLLLLIAGVVFPAFTLGADADPDIARWQRETRGVTIIRDQWGIAHIRATTDAGAVFGAVYAQAEDDFNRVETNYINAMGRLAETE